MESGGGIVQIIHPRQPSVIAIWSLYAVILVALIVAIASVLVDQESDKSSRHDFNPYNINKSMTLYRPDKLAEKDETRLNPITLEEVVAYECFFDPGIKNISWLEESDDMIVYRDGYIHKHGIVMNVTTGYIVSYPDYPDSIPDGRSMQMSENRQDHATMTNVNEDDGRVGQNVAISWNCYRSEKTMPTNVECQYSIRILSSATDEAPVSPPTVVELASTQFARRGSTALRHTYSIGHIFTNHRIFNANHCTIKTLEDYHLTCTSHWAGPIKQQHMHKTITAQYTISISEICPTQQLSRWNEFTFDSQKESINDSQASKGKEKIYQRYRRVSSRTTFKNIGYLEQQWITTTNRCSRVENQQPIRDKSGRRRALRSDDTLVDEKNRKNHDNKRKCTLSKYMFEIARIGKTPWILHSIVHFSSLYNVSMINMAISGLSTLNRECKSHESQGHPDIWIPHTSQRYKPLLGDDFYVTQILAAKIESEDEASVYFIAAPFANVSRRFLYKIQVVYPPLEYSTLEPVTCLTCPKTNHDNTSELYPQCIWVDVQMSQTYKNYIINCRGPELPWSSVISTDNNQIIRRLDTWIEFRAWHSAKSIPHEHEFVLVLDNGIRARVKLYMPFDWNMKLNKYGECRNKFKLLLRLANKQDGQMVDAQFDLSLTTYLAGVKGYAVIHADVRGSAFQSLDLLETKFQDREAMQIADYVQVAQLVANRYQCVDTRVGFGVIGKAYGGHMVLNLIAGEDESDTKETGNPFVCGAAMEPFSIWQAYVYPFTMKSSSQAVTSLRKKLYKHQYLSPLTVRLQGRDFALFSVKSKEPARRLYEENLLELLARNRVEYEYQHYGEDCSSRLRQYQDLSAFLDRCFERQYAKKSL